MKLLVLNGANINFIGIREPNIYGRETFQDLINKVQAHCDEIGVEVQFYQSNHEGCLVDAIQQAYFDKIDGIIFNPGAYTHTSLAIADAVKGVAIPTVEVHISAVEKREAFRQISYIRDVSVKTITGHGLDGYNMAVDFLVENYKKD